MRILSGKLLEKGPGFLNPDHGFIILPPIPLSELNHPINRPMDRVADCGFRFTRSPCKCLQISAKYSYPFPILSLAEDEESFRHGCSRLTLDLKIVTTECDAMVAAVAELRFSPNRPNLAIVVVFEDGS